MIRKLLEWLEDGWRLEDSGIWEVRGPARHFTHSKVMAWVAFDRAIRFHEEFDRRGPVDRWRALRDEIHAEVLEHGWSEEKQSFTQSYGSEELDASLLLLPLVGFLPPADERIVSTVEAIRRELTVDGLVLRYRVGEQAADDGLPGDEGVFLPCSFWLTQVLALQGRHEEARELFERLLDLRNDVGLLSEEYDPRAGSQLGNFPQAFTHLALVDAAIALGRAARCATSGLRSRPFDANMCSHWKTRLSCTPIWTPSTRLSSSGTTVGCAGARSSSGAGWCSQRATRPKPTASEPP